MSNTELKTHKRSNLNRFLNFLAVASSLSGFLLTVVLNLTGYMPIGSPHSALPVLLGGLLFFFIKAFAEWGHILDAEKYDDVREPPRTKAWFASVMALIMFLVVFGSLV